MNVSGCSLKGSTSKDFFYDLARSLLLRRSVRLCLSKMVISLLGRMGTVPIFSKLPGIL